MQVHLPNNWSPRPYQRKLWSYLGAGGKRAVACWHRRAGKDDVCLHHTALAAHERVGNYWHMLPEYAQARKAIWDRINPKRAKRGITKPSQGKSEKDQEGRNIQKRKISFKTGLPGKWSAAITSIPWSAQRWWG